MVKVTIAIPVYNVENYIETSLISALEQSYPNIEFIIIDDKGNDKSIDVVKRIKQSHKRGAEIRIIDHGVNKGTGATRNTAIDNAHGDYLFFMDSDDSIENNTIESLVRALDNYSFDVIESSFQLTKSGGIVLNADPLPNDVQFGDYAICKWMTKNRRYYDGYPWNRLYRLKFLRDNNIRCVDNHRNEDVFFSFQIVIHAVSYKTISNFTYNYFVRKGSTVHQSLNDYYYYQYLEIMDLRVKVMNDVLEDGRQVPNVLFNYLIHHFFEWWINRVLGSKFSQEKKIYFYNHIKKSLLDLNICSGNLIGHKYKYLNCMLNKLDYKQYFVGSLIIIRIFQIVKVIRKILGIKRNDFL